MRWRWIRRGIGNTLLVVACLGGIAIALPRQQAIPVNCQNKDCKQPKLPKTPLPAEQVQGITEAITVKVLSKELLGSGFLIKKEKQVYTVITNAHVLRSADPPYQIQTPDGRIYSAVVFKIQFHGNDLALLQFRSTDADYAVAKVGDSSSLKVGNKVFVGGFTSKANNQANQKNLSPNHSKPTQREAMNRFIFTTGQVTLVLDKALEGGYQIGYTNDIRKGMSGAPLLNHQGEVVGINGLHKDPVWDAPELYQDGSSPDKPLQNLITRSSLAVPIKTVVQMAPQFVAPNTPG